MTGFYKINLKKVILFIGDFLGNENTYEYGLISINEYRISFIDNVVGKNSLLIYVVIKFIKGKYLMKFMLWSVLNAIYMKNFQVLAINNLISQEEGGLNMNL